MSDGIMTLIACNAADACLQALRKCRSLVIGLAPAQSGAQRLVEDIFMLGGRHPVPEELSLFCLRDQLLTMRRNIDYALHMLDIAERAHRNYFEVVSGGRPDNEETET